MPQREDTYTPAVGECPLCGYPMDAYQCKLACPNCGYREDCSDSSTSGPMEPPTEEQAATDENARPNS